MAGFPAVPPVSRSATSAPRQPWAVRSRCFATATSSTSTSPPASSRSGSRTRSWPHDARPGSHARLVSPADGWRATPRWPPAPIRARFCNGESKPLSENVSDPWFFPRPERTFSDRLQKRATIFVVERNSFRFARSCILSRSCQKCDRRGANGMNSVLRLWALRDRAVGNGLGQQKLDTGHPERGDAIVRKEQDSRDPIVNVNEDFSLFPRRGLVAAIVVQKLRLGVALQSDSHRGHHAARIDQRESKPQAADELRLVQVEPEIRVGPEDFAALAIPIDLNDLGGLRARCAHPERSVR